jgi:hypothetical protein
MTFSWSPLVKAVNRGCSLEVLFPSAALTAPMPTCEARPRSRDLRDHELGRNHIMTTWSLTVSHSYSSDRVCLQRGVVAIAALYQSDFTSNTSFGGPVAFRACCGAAAVSHKVPLDTQTLDCKPLWTRRPPIASSDEQPGRSPHWWKLDWMPLVLVGCRASSPSPRLLLSELANSLRLSAANDCRDHSPMPAANCSPATVSFRTLQNMYKL